MLMAAAAPPCLHPFMQRPGGSSRLPVSKRSATSAQMLRPSAAPQPCMWPSPCLHSTAQHPPPPTPPSLAVCFGLAILVSLLCGAVFWRLRWHRTATALLWLLWLTIALLMLLGVGERGQGQGQGARAADRARRRAANQLRPSMLPRACCCLAGDGDKAGARTAATLLRPPIHPPSLALLPLLAPAGLLNGLYVVSADSCKYVEFMSLKLAARKIGDGQRERVGRRWGRGAGRAHATA